MKSPSAKTFFATLGARWAEPPRSNLPAANWAHALPGTTLAIPVLKNATTVWARQDAAAAGAWLKQLPPSTLRDQAVASYCQVLAVQNLDTISQWAQTINDSSLREQSLLHIAEEWMGRNP